VKAKDKIKLLVSNTKAQVQKLKQQGIIQHPKVPVSDLHQQTHKSAPVFVLSTGRTGTQLLTNIFALSNKVLAHHEPDPNLNYYGKLAWEGAKEPAFFEGVFEGARYEMLRDAVILGKTYIETNNRITFLAKHILTNYPNAKFVHLVRKPEAFVKSGLGRDWYANTNIHDEGRIVKAGGWGSMDQVAKIAWLWAETNRWIFEFGKTLPAGQFLFLKSEDLYKDSKSVLALLHFCGVMDVNLKAIEKTILEPVNISKKPSDSIDEKTRLLIKEQTSTVSKLIYE